MIQRNHLAVKRIEREQTVRRLISRELIAEIDLADVDRRERQVARFQLNIVAVRSFTLLAEHVVSSRSSPELTIDAPREFFGQQRDAATGIQQKVTWLALDGHVNLPEGFAKAL